MPRYAVPFRELYVLKIQMNNKKRSSGKAPFVVLPLVQTFDFRVLRQNRRVVQDEARREEIELFHTILTDISHCEPTKSVRDFIVGAYVRGASVGTAEHSPLDGNTAVFTKRRYRDAWNRCVTRRISKSHNHTVKIKAKVRARGQRGQNWYSDRRVSFLRSKCRTQNSWLLHLASDHILFCSSSLVLNTPDNIENIDIWQATITRVSKRSLCCTSHI